MNNSDVKKLYREYGVTNEKELQEKLMLESITVPCICCKRQILVTAAHWHNGDPVCNRRSR